jgi:hypothetical protein
VERFGEDDYERAATDVFDLLGDPDAPARCRRLAQEVFSLRDVGIPRYDALYRAIAATR